MINKFINLTGKRFGKLIVIKHIEKDKYKHHKWLCLCDCGKEKFIRNDHLKNGDTKSCGCIQRERATKHGHYKNNKQSKEYRTWNHMIQRCSNPNFQYYKNYGGRGIKFCKHWLKFPNFLKDMGKSPGSGYSIDRIDNDGNYCKSNCRWTTRKEQGRNKRNNISVNYNGKKQLIIELAEQFCISYAVFRSRINRGWPVKEALTTPVGKYIKKLRYKL